MTDLDDQLNRLFRAGASAGGTMAAMSAPFGMETRVLAAWREAQSFGGWSPALLRRGLWAAGAIMVLSLWPVVGRSVAPDPNSDYVQLADSTVQVNSGP